MTFSVEIPNKTMFSTNSILSSKVSKSIVGASWSSGIINVTTLMFLMSGVLTGLCLYMLGDRFPRKNSGRHNVQHSYFLILIDYFEIINY